MACDNANQHVAELPRAVQTVLESTYMDDGLDSVPDTDTGIQLYHQLVEIWGRAGMKARKWLSNSTAILAHIPESERAADVQLQSSELPMSKTLGILWSAETDNFTFAVAGMGEEFLVTKRSFLSKLATVFDPLGFVAPVLVTGKILLQRMWAAGLDWDQTPPN